MSDLAKDLKTLGLHYVAAHVSDVIDLATRHHLGQRDFERGGAVMVEQLPEAYSGPGERLPTLRQRLEETLRRGARAAQPIAPAQLVGGALRSGEHAQVLRVLDAPAGVEGASVAGDLRGAVEHPRGAACVRRGRVFVL